MAQTKALIVLVMVLISFTCAQEQVDKKRNTTETPTTTSTTESTTTGTTTTTASTTSTAVPDTTTTPPSTTTARPEPPSPGYSKWAWTEDNKTCVIVQFAMQFNLTYTAIDDKPSNVLYNIPANETAASAGSCGKDNQWITVTWRNTSSITLQFSVNDTQFMLSEIHLNLNVSREFSDAKANQSLNLFHVHNDFTTPVANSYHCNKVQSLEFTKSKDSNVTVANATIAHLQLEAFHQQKNQEFSTARDCEAMDTPDIVPIAVGCALAGLVLVVLIAYLVGRRRAQARGYLSM